MKTTYSFKTIALISFAAFVAVFILLFFENTLQIKLLIASFGATLILGLGFPEAPFSQPKNIIVGHFFGALIGLLCFHFLPVENWAIAFSVALTIALMLSTNAVHPPAAGNPIIIYTLKAPFSFLFFPILTGSLFLVLFFIIINKFIRKKIYPNAL